MKNEHTVCYTVTLTAFQYGYDQYPIYVHFNTTQNKLNKKRDYNKSIHVFTCSRTKVDITQSHSSVRKDEERKKDRERDKNEQINKQYLPFISESESWT